MHSSLAGAAADSSSTKESPPAASPWWLAGEEGQVLRKGLIDRPPGAPCGTVLPVVLCSLWYLMSETAP